MWYTDFYTISDKDTRGALNLIPKQNLDYTKVFRSEIVPDTVLEFVPNYGVKHFDFLNSGFAGVFLISKKIVELFRSNDIVGWNSIPVRIQGYEDQNYYLLTVEGRCSAIDYGRSETFLKKPYAPSGKPIEVKRGLYFDLESWDLSDVFTPENTRFTFITEKVKNILSVNKVTNILIERITDFELL